MDAEPGDGTPWHALTVEAALERLAGRPDGLASREAAARLAKHGPNRLPEARRAGALSRLAQQCRNLLIYVLLAASLLSLLMGHAIDAAVIFLVVVLNAAIGFVQEGRAERALDAIRGMIDPRATVLRDGARLTVAAEEVVPGDIVLLEAGDRVTADLRLVRARNLKIEEAVLTGESVPVDKTTQPVAAEAALGDRAGMAFSGTFVASGQAAGVAVATGAATELGRISTMLDAVRSLKTPLVRQMDRFARQLTIVILAVAALTCGFALLVRDYALNEAFLAMVGLAVAAIPEGLPAIMTIALAIGVQRMASRHAIIRRLPAVETLGSVSVICSDKTGTLTRNEMTASRVLLAGGEITATGVGYRPDGELHAGGVPVDPGERQDLVLLLTAGALCNDAELRRTEAGWIVDGDPMEGALLTLARKGGLDPAALRMASPRISDIPFDSKHKFMATLHRAPGASEGLIVVKGAPEKVLAMCARTWTPPGRQAAAIDADAWHRAGERLAAEGQRLLAVAVRTTPAAVEDLTPGLLDEDLAFLGLVGLIDPPRDEAIAAIADCRSAGIRVIMITGDHAVTAAEIARQLGLADRPAVMTGADLDRLDRAGLSDAARRVDVFARTTPENKLKLVAALQEHNLTVAMTGDGVNDAPALKRADVGIAMGRKGTEAAKEASEMVLADDNFASIVAAVREGRTVYDNLRKSITFLLPINGGESLSLVLAILLGIALPIAPLQILWVNMVSSVALAAVLAFEPTEDDVMRRPPRKQGESLLSGFVIWRVALVSVLFMIGIFGMHEHVLAGGGSEALARTVAVNTLVAMEIFYLFSVRYLKRPSFTFQGVKGTPRVLAAVAAVVVLQALFTYAPPLQFLFRTEPVPLLLGVQAVLVGVGVLLVLEIEKLAHRRLIGRSD